MLIKDYPDVETKIRDAITSKGFGLGKVIYAKGNSTSIIAILTVVKSNQNMIMMIIMIFLIKRRLN